VRLLHTADWHLGRTIRGRSRLPEFEAVLAEVCGIAVDEDVDVFLVAGDIWDTMSPSPEAERLLYGALRRLVEARIDVVLVAGNHDNPKRLAAFGSLVDLLGVHVQDRVKRWDEGGTIRIERNGETMLIAAVPWVPEGRALKADEILGPEFESYQQYAEVVDGIYRRATKGFQGDAINVFAAHVFIDDARIALFDGSERRLHIGQTYGVAPAMLPGHAQYVALGHVHEPQEVLGAPNGAATYSGSLLQLDFGERDQQKIVRLVDLEPGRPGIVRAVPLTAGRRLGEVRGTFEEVVEHGSRLPDLHLRAVVSVPRPEPGLAQRIREALPNCVDVSVTYTDHAEEREEVPLSMLGPQESFTRYHEHRHGTPPAPEVLALFREVLDEATRAVEEE